MSIVNDIVDLISKQDERINWDDYFISIAFLISSRSSCNRLHVGCVIVKDTRIISVGYNGFLPGALIIQELLMVMNNQQFMQNRTVFLIVQREVYL